MQVSISPKSGFITENKKCDYESVLEEAGVKAAVCFREGSITPDLIRSTESKE